MNPPEETTLGQILVNDLLPEEYRDYNRQLYKKEFGALLKQLANERPDEYKDIVFNLGQASIKFAQQNGGFSFSVPHLLKSPTAARYQEVYKKQMIDILNDESLTSDERQAKIVQLGIETSKKQKADLMEEQVAKKNPIALAIKCGARGSDSNANSLMGGDYFYEDDKREAVPMPVLHSYGSGLMPSEYAAGAYGARQGILDTKLAIRDAGALAKNLARISYRGLVTKLDGEDQNQNIGYAVDVSDSDNMGALLARDTGGYPRNTILTNRILKDLEDQGIKRMLVRSPITGGAPDGGLYAKDVGVREKNRLLVVGENPTIAAAQSMAEPLSQGAMSSKHSGGVYGVTSKAVTGFKDVKQMLEVPAIYNGATHSDVDGRVTAVEPGKAGGVVVTIGGVQHFIQQGLDPVVKVGDEIEAGDILSSGLPNPSKIVEHKGVGEGRAYFVKSMSDNLKHAGLGISRRNVELLSRALINHVQVNDFYDKFNPGELIPYSTFAASYVPRDDSHETEASSSALNSYLERPVLHYTIGTKIRPSVLKNLKEFGIKSILTNKEPPAFTPKMISSRGFLKSDPDWLTRMAGSNLSQGLLDSVATSASSDLKGTSFVPGLAFDPHFGESGKVRSLSGPLHFQPISVD